MTVAVRPRFSRVRTPTLTPSIVLDNVTTLFGISLAPWMTSPLIQSDFGTYPGSHGGQSPEARHVRRRASGWAVCLIAVTTRGSVCLALPRVARRDRGVFPLPELPADSAHPDRHGLLLRGAVRGAVLPY